MSHSVLSLQLPKSHLQGTDIVVIILKTLNFGASFFLVFDIVVINSKTLNFGASSVLNFNFVVIILKSLDLATGFFLGFDFVVVIFKPQTVVTCKQAYVQVHLSRLCPN